MLPKRERITAGKEIKSILGRKQLTWSSPLLSFVAEENNFLYSRLAVVCSKRLGSAVVRNRTRRLVVNAFLKIRRNYTKNADIVIVPKKVSDKLQDYFIDVQKALNAIS